MLQASLGLGFDPERLHVTFEEPALPAFLDEVTLLNLRLDGGAVDVALRRSGSKVVVDVLERRGTLKVLTTN